MKRISIGVVAAALLCSSSAGWPTDAIPTFGAPWVEPAILRVMRIQAADRDVLSSAGRASSESCIGDCSGDRFVTVDEILTLVGMALGNLAVTVCSAADSNSDGQITVDEILLAVGNALGGCVQADVFGSWFSDEAALVTSDCGPLFDAVVESFLGLQAACLFEVSGSRSSTTVVNCNEVRFTGHIDDAGNLEVESGVTEQSPLCDYSFSVELSADLSRDPTAATFDFALTFSPGCGLSSCRAVFQSEWSR